jgi:hypothetical protein
MRLGDKIKAKSHEIWDVRVILVMEIGQMDITGEVTNTFEFQGETVYCIDHMSVGNESELTPIPQSAWIPESLAPEALEVIGSVVGDLC